LAADSQLGQKQLDLAAVERRIETAVERWQVLAAAGRFLDDVRRGYERDRQPETLREASQYLQRMTQGRYVRVWTPFGEDVLRVDDAEGRASPIEALSRGTREQLFLSLRLALAAWYGRHGAPLPLVLDDVLVNFDAARAAAAAEVLRDFAADGRQLLVFTCHEHIAAIFASLGAAVSRLPDNSAAQPATVRMHVAAAASRPAAIPSAPATESPPEPPRRRPSRRKRTEPAEGLRIAVEPPAEVVHRPAPVPAPVAAPAPSPPVVAPAPALHWAPIPTPVSAPVSTSPPPAPVPARVVVAAPRPIRRPGAVFDADFFDSAEEAAEEDEDRGFRRRAAAEPQPPADDLDARYAAGEASATAAFWDEPGDLPYDPPDYGNEAEAA
jgi:hypothetical protein